jgi:ParB family transcriptional regulator, chromosome partitioning protein
VRPSLQAQGRYQVAFGHRRLRAAKVLGRHVRAVVKVLTDRDLVLAQGQENSARANLSFIERALFARRLEDGGYDRETIMSALSVDKTVVSKMVSVASRIPVKIIEAIGSAPSIGRDRWVELSTAFQNEAKVGKLDPLVMSRAFVESTSDDRFDLLLAHFGLPDAPKKPRSAKDDGAPARFWAATNGIRVARITSTDKAFVLAIDKRVAPEFGDYLLARMERLYADYEDQQKEN